ncbi:MAG: ABC transporter ATP-binding protein, partial [Bdellovibrionales bacterium]|nr:ABC transporter ATP-binding protein [Bdellovibrionales bacterium]
PVAILVSASLIPLLRIEDRKAKFAENIRTMSVRHHKKLWPSFFDLSDVKIVDQVKTMLKSDWAVERVKNLSDNIMRLYSKLHGGILRSDIRAWGINAAVTTTSAGFILAQHLAGSVSAGAAVQFVFAAVNLQVAIVAITKFRGTQAQSAPYVNRSFNLNNIWRKFHPTDEKYNNQELEALGQKLKTEPFSIQMDGVKVMQGETCILDIDRLTLKSDEYIGLVGLRGAGKTTLIRTLLGLVEPSEGTVTISCDGMSFDLEDIPLEVWHGAIGWSPQDGYDGRTLKILERILLGVPDNATREEIMHVMSVTGADEFLEYEDLDQVTIGKNIEREEEKNRTLSGGEQQTVTNMSALLGDNRVLILDEPTARLDIKNAKILDRELESTRAGRLQIVITHRLSALKNTDKIIVLVDGHIESVGTHYELEHRKDELYHQLLEEHKS